MNFLKLAEERYSVRKFTQEPIAQEAIDKILKAGYVAPTAKNLQPQRVMVINSEEALEKLQKATKCHFDTKTAMVICYNKEECYQRPYDGKISGEIDASIVTTHMMLEAASLGIGSTWVMHFRPEVLKNEFAIPENLEPTAILVMGYPAEDAAPGPMHEQFRPMEELVSYNKF
uniref:nitroreductase family protein n=1 Tax=Agathobacter sp. TaxID=2021311 RepID=UPI0040573601